MSGSFSRSAPGQAEVCLDVTEECLRATLAGHKPDCVGLGSAGVEEGIGCLQVYPWSELCGGDAAGFIVGFADENGLSLPPR